MADLNSFWMKVSKISGIWFDKSKIIEMEFFDMFDAFLNMYPIFSDYFEKLANVFTNKSALAIFGVSPFDVAGLQVATISDTLMSVILEQLLPEVIVEDRKKKAGYTTIFALMNSIPMSDCFQLGYKFGSLLRMLEGKTLVHVEPLIDMPPIDIPLGGL